MKKQIILISLFSGLLAACGSGPAHREVQLEVPAGYRGDASQAPPNSRSLAEHAWSDVFQDEELQQLIRTALEDNFEVQIAAARVAQARARLGITRADQLPLLTGGAAVSNQRIPGSGPIPAIETSPTEVSLALSWETDFWGKYRRATEASRAELLADEWARHAVTTTLIAEVATAYFQLRELDLELEIAKRSLSTRKESLRLVRLKEQAGTSSMLEVHQAEQLVHTAAGRIPDLERRIEQQENLISILLGMNPTTIPRGLDLTEQPQATDFPPGLPSSLLERRPDIRAVEQHLIAASARIEAARTAYFPQVALTASGGYRSSALTSLFSGPAGLWSFIGSLVQPIFTGGRIESNLNLTEAQQREVLLVYQQTVQQAFREVSDALIAHQKSRESRLQQEHLTQSARETARLSDLRYRRGAASYLEVLDSDTRYFDAEVGLAESRLNELLALVQLYKALGGGWE